MNFILPRTIRQKKRKEKKDDKYSVKRSNRILRVEAIRCDAGCETLEARGIHEYRGIYYTDDHFFGDDRGYRWALHAIAFSTDATCDRADSSICCSPGNQRCSLLPGPTPTPPTFIFKLSFARSFSLYDSPPTRIPRRKRAYIPFCFHFPCIFLYFVYLYIYVKQLFKIGKKNNEFLFRYLESKVNLKLTFSPLKHSTQKTFPPKRSVAIKYRVNNPPRTKRLDR